MKNFIILTLTIFSSFACAHRTLMAPVAVDEGVTDRRLSNLGQKAEAELGCPVEKISGEHIGRRLYSLHGCGHGHEYFMSCILMVNPYGIGYGENCVWITVGNVLKQASFDLNCPIKNFEPWEVIGDSIIGVHGCAKRATYMLACEPRRCNWIMASPPQTGTHIGGPPTGIPPPPSEPPPPDWQQNPSNSDTPDVSNEEF